MVSMHMGLQMKMSQQLIMTPQLQQAIKLLQLSRQELEELIDQSLIENPALEITPVEVEKEEKEDQEKREEPTDFIEEQSQVTYDDEWQNYVESGAGVIQETRHTSSSDYSNDSNPLESTISKGNSLMDHLLWQLDMSDFSDLEQQIARFLIGNTDEDGYLSTSLKEIIAGTRTLRDLIQTGLDSNEWGIIDDLDATLYESHHSHKLVQTKEKKKKKKAAFLEEEENQIEEVDLSEITDEQCYVAELVLHKIQRLDPNGVGSRNLQECLEIQLEMMGLKGSLAYSIIQQDMKLLEQRDLKRIARHQKAKIEDVVEAYEIITILEPKPGRPFAKEVTQYVIPDVYIYKRGVEYIVSLNQDNLPALRINPDYLEITKTQDVKENTPKKEKTEEEDLTNQYLVEKIRGGEWLMKSIEQRQKTIYRVAKSILKFQYEFFEKGIDYLKPLVLKDVAEDIDVHESTVSRITTNKYVHTPQGIFELKYFFTSGIAQSDGDIISSKKIKDHIRKLIANEDLKKPLTDIQIAKELHEKASIKVARRTVAKYREALGILPSNKRKRLY
ncbi:MAG: RNA polymerase sigma-54 factor [bacterium]|jgi:RNA polymerase sigma-54 factor